MDDCDVVAMGGREKGTLFGSFTTMPLVPVCPVAPGIMT